MIKIKKKRRRLKKKVKIVLVIVTVFLVVLAWNSYSKKIEVAIEAKETSMRIKEEKAAKKEAIKKEELAAKKALEKEKEQAVVARKKLTDDMIQLDSEYEGTVGFIFLDKDTNEQVEVNPDHVFTSASLYKLYVTYAVLTEVDKGNLTLDTVMNSQSGETVGDYLHDTIT